MFDPGPVLVRTDGLCLCAGLNRRPGPNFRRLLLLYLCE